VISVLFMGEIVTWQVAMGGAATLAGVALVALSERRLAKASETNLEPT
jgi:drug/metabolite transporter (DMT)-like permease